jgi:hypothetical protein
MAVISSFHHKKFGSYCYHKAADRAMLRGVFNAAQTILIIGYNYSPRKATPHSLNIVSCLKAGIVLSELESLLGSGVF